MGHDATIADLMDCILFQLQLAQQLRDANQGADRSRFLGKDQQKAGGPTSPFNLSKLPQQSREGKAKNIPALFAKRKTTQLKSAI